MPSKVGNRVGKSEGILPTYTTHLGKVESVLSIMMQLEQEVHLVAVCKSMLKAMRSMQALSQRGVGRTGKSGKWRKWGENVVGGKLV